jgi:hypothetical protein
MTGLLLVMVSAASRSLFFGENTCATWSHSSLNVHTKGWVLSVTNPKAGTDLTREVSEFHGHDEHHGFARVRCHEFFVAFSCTQRCRTGGSFPSEQKIFFYTTFFT